MAWIWPLRHCTPLLPDEPGWFGTIRRHDTHTGIDLYCVCGQVVQAVEAGGVIRVEAFTGPNAEDPSPWWNDTWAVLVRGDSGVVVYGEIQPSVQVGDLLQAGQTVGTVLTVLQKDKGRPMTMLHLELLAPEATCTLWWMPHEPQPFLLRDPTTKLLEAAGPIREIYHGPETGQ